MDGSAGAVRLEAKGAEAAVAFRGAEPVRWLVGGRDLLWSGDPAHWAFRAPLLFPVVGASAGGHVTIDGVAHPMPQHGFARHAAFDLVAATTDSAHLRLSADASTREAYPFAFRLDVRASLTPTSFALAFEVVNEGEVEMPYSLGIHPAFPWPLDGGTRAGHRVVFDEPERSEVPEVAPGGLLSRRRRAVPLDGCELPLAPELFTEALVFLDARSRAFSLQAPTGASVRLEVDGFPHLAVWTKPDAPFVSLEAWSGHADHEGFAGEFRDRASVTRLAPGDVGRHAARWLWTAGPAG